MTRIMTFSLTEDEQKQMSALLDDSPYRVQVVPKEEIERVWNEIAVEKRAEFKKQHCSVKRLPKLLSIHYQRVYNPKTLNSEVRYHIEARFD